jgi:hypothetical protein
MTYNSSVTILYLRKLDTVVSLFLNLVPTGICGWESSSVTASSPSQSYKMKNVCP